MLVVKNPSTGEVIRELEYATSARVESNLARAAELHRKGALPAWERIAILKKAGKLLEERHEEFAQMIALEGGKPLKDARVEATRAVDGIDNAIEVLRSEGGREIPMGVNVASAHRLAFTTREPIGAVVAVSAFNHPLNLVIHQLVPAVAMGCPVMIKPASTTPLSCLNFVALLKEAGLPDGWCEAMVLANADAEKLVTDPRVAFFSFIGSAGIGWMLRSKLAPGTRCALEHGGVAPVDVERDADLDRLIPALLKGGYYHAGQVCVSVQRLFVHESIVDTFSEKWTAAVSGLTIGAATEASTEVGPLILPKEVDRVETWVSEAVSGGGKLLTGGSRIDEHFYQPTVVLNPPEGSKLATSEVFGPVTTIHPFSEPEEAIAAANGLDVAFQAAVASQDIDRALFYARRLDAAAVMINDHTAFRVDWMPFAGRRSSGHGTGGIPNTMHEMSAEKMIVLHSPGL